MPDNAKTAIVCLHGFMGAPSDFEALAGLLNKHADCYLPDLPQAVSTPLVFEEIVVTWFKTLREKLPEQFYLFGYSMGGRISLVVADYLQKEEPESLLGLLLESAHPGFKKGGDCYQRLLWDTAWAKAFAYEGMELVLGRWFQQSIFHGLTVDQVEALIDQRKFMNGEDLATQMIQFSLGWQPDYRPMLAKQAVPVHYFSGDLDKKFTFLGSELEGVQHHIAPGCSHNIHYQQPAWLAEKIISIINN